MARPYLHTNNRHSEALPAHPITQPCSLPWAGEGQAGQPLSSRPSPNTKQMPQERNNYLNYSESQIQQPERTTAPLWQREGFLKQLVDAVPAVVTEHSVLAAWGTHSNPVKSQFWSQTPPLFPQHFTANNGSPLLQSNTRSVFNFSPKGMHLLQTSCVQTPRHTHQKLMCQVLKPCRWKGTQSPPKDPWDILPHNSQLPHAFTANSPFLCCQHFCLTWCHINLGNPNGRLQQPTQI